MKGMTMNSGSTHGEVDTVPSFVPETIGSRVVYEGKVISMRIDEITLPHGGTATREVVEHPGAVVIIAIDQERQVYLVRQYRQAIRRMLLELPAGTLEPGEEPLSAAKRELREEVGLEGEDWRYLGSFFSSPGFVNEHMHVFLAVNLSQQESDPDYDEDLAVVRMPLSELSRRLGEVPDAKTLAALHLLQEDPYYGYRG
jgi:ADP-ribose pyrophosphatase